MPVQVTCSCGKRLSAKDHLAGKTVRCPACKNPLKIPPLEPEEPAEEEASPIGNLLDEYGFQQTKTELRCPGCGRDLAAEAMVCIQCGYNKNLGRRMDTQRGPASRRAPAPTKPSPGPSNPYASPADVEPVRKGRRRAAGGRRNGPPWESDDASLASFVETTRQVLFSPPRLFRNMMIHDSVGAAAYFAIYSYAFLFLVSIAWIAALSLVSGRGLPTAGPVASGALGFVCGMACLSIIVPMVLLIMTCIVHVALLIMGGATNGFVTTFRVIAYTHGATNVVAAVPVIGPFVSPIFWVISTTVGIRETHETSTAVAAVAVLTPTGLVIFLGVMAVMNSVGVN